LTTDCRYHVMLYAQTIEMLQSTGMIPVVKLVYLSSFNRIHAVYMLFVLAPNVILPTFPLCIVLINLGAGRPYQHTSCSRYAVFFLYKFMHVYIVPAAKSSINK